MPPGADATGHFRENTAILSLAAGGRDAENGRWFHENSMSRRSPAKPAAALLPRREPGPARAGEHEEPEKVERWRRRREMKGRRRTRDRRDGEMESIGWEGHLCFLGLGGEASRAIIDHAVRGRLALARRAWPTWTHALTDALRNGGNMRREMGKFLGAV